MRHCNTPDFVIQPAAAATASAGPWWHLGTAGWPFQARRSASFHRCHWANVLWSTLRKVVFRPVHVKTAIVFILQSEVSSYVPTSNVHVMLLAEHLVVQQECSVHGSVFGPVLAKFNETFFRCLTPGKTTDVESNSILWSDPVLFEFRLWPKEKSWGLSVYSFLSRRTERGEENITLENIRLHLLFHSLCLHNTRNVRNTLIWKNQSNTRMNDQFIINW